MDTSKERTYIRRTRESFLKRDSDDENSVSGNPPSAEKVNPPDSELNESSVSFDSSLEANKSSMNIDPQSSVNIESFNERENGEDMSQEGKEGEVTEENGGEKIVDLEHTTSDGAEIRFSEEKKEDFMVCGEEEKDVAEEEKEVLGENENEQATQSDDQPPVTASQVQALQPNPIINAPEVASGTNSTSSSFQVPPCFEDEEFMQFLLASNDLGTVCISSNCLIKYSLYLFRIIQLEST